MSREAELKGFKLVKHKMAWEGFDYCFRFYSDFLDDVKDEDFHLLREGYLNGKVSSRDLEFYVNMKIEELENE